jgi:hypothetical protein
VIPGPTPRSLGPVGPGSPGPPPGRSSSISGQTYHSAKPPFLVEGISSRRRGIGRGLGNSGGREPRRRNRQNTREPVSGGSFDAVWDLLKSGARTRTTDVRRISQNRGKHGKLLSLASFGAWQTFELGKLWCELLSLAKKACHVVQTLVRTCLQARCSGVPAFFAPQPVSRDVSRCPGIPQVLEKHPFARMFSPSSPVWARVTLVGYEELL